MRRVLPLLALVSLAFAPLPFPKTSEADLKAMQGEWVLVGESHATGPPRHMRHLRASVADRRVTFSPEGDAPAGEWAVTLVASEAPKAIDLTRGGDGLRLIRGVYSLKGDTLVLCWNVGVEATRPRTLPGNIPVACKLTFKRKRP
jgi:uncharacterized protein (TIGR03067 family)